MGNSTSIPMTLGAGGALLTLGVLADVCGGLGAGSTLATVAIKALGIGAGGAAGNAIWEAIGGSAKAVRERLRDPASRLRNHDLQALAGRAMAAVVAAAAKDYKGGASGKKYLAKLARTIPAGWDSFTPDARYASILDSEIPRFFGSTAAPRRTATALNEGLWQDLLGAIGGKEVDASELDALQFAAGRLSSQFPRALLELAKEDFAPGATGSPHDGKAFAALLLSLTRDTMGGIGSLLRADQDSRVRDSAILTEIQAVRKKLDARAAEIVRLAPPDIAAIVTPIKSEIDVLSFELADTLGTLLTRVTEVGEGVLRLEEGQAEEISILRRVEAMLKAQAVAKPTPSRTATGVTNIPAPEPHWIHREKITHAIRAMLLSKGGTASLTAAVATAAGGYGKTFAARIYAHQHAAAYPGGRLEIMVEKGDFVSQLGLLLPLLSPGNTLPPDQAAPIVRDMLSKPPSSLLIIDNVKSERQWAEIAATGMLPTGGCHVLLTTREDDVLPDRAVPVPRFTTEEAWTILARARPDALDEANVKPVGCALRAADGLGVAIGAIAARMRATPATPWKAYWASLKAAHPALFAADSLPPLFRPADAPADANQTARHHAILDDCFAHLPPVQRRALEYAALLPQDLAPRPWLEWLMDKDGACAPPETGASVVAALVEAELLTPAGEEGKLLSLHRLWRSRVNQKAEEGGTDRTGLLLAIAACAAARRATIIGTNPDGTKRVVNNPTALTDGGVRWELTPLAQVCNGLWETGHPGLGARVGVWLAAVLLQLGRFAEAAACLQLSDETDAGVEAAIGHEELAAAYSNLAVIQREQGDLPGARGSMERAIAICLKHLATDHPNFGSAYSNLALIQRDQGDLPGARGSMERAIAIDSKHFPLDHPTFATRYSNLAGIQQDQGDLPGARRSMEKAIAIWSQHLSGDHPNFGSAYSNLALIQQDEGDLPGARGSMERAIAIESKHFPPDHPTFASSYSNLAGIQQDQGDLARARGSMERAIAIESKHFPPDHPNFAIRYSNLAMIQQDQGDLPGARESMARAIDIKLKHFGPDHPNMAISPDISPLIGWH